MKLISFAYAGGDGHAFYPLAKEIKKIGIKLEPFFYKGRGSRQDEGHYQSISEAANDAADYIDRQNLCEDYAMLGHSMGCLIVYECYFNLLRRGCKLPKAIYFSGSLPPDCLSQDRFSAESDDEFIEKIKLLGGMNPEILELAEFREFYLPILKNDIKIFQEYQYQDKKYDIDVPVTVLTGSSDDVRGNRVVGWKKHTSKKPDFLELDGDHFFLFNNKQDFKKVFSKLI